MKKTIEVINGLKEEGLIIDYAIGGAIGVLKWVEPFKNKGYHEWTGQWIVIEGIPTEFIPAEGLARESVANAEEIKFEGAKTKVITPEYLVALLLKAGREKDIIKIRMLLEQARINKKKLHEILARYDLGGAFKPFIGKS